MAPRRFDDEEITKALEELDWERDGAVIVKEVTLEDFGAALAWVNAVGALAEERDHHPDIEISWNKVTLHLSTHSAGGLTNLDFELARAVDQITL